MIRLAVVGVALLTAGAANAQTHRSGTVEEIRRVYAPAGVAVGNRGLTWVEAVRAPAATPDGATPELQVRLNFTALPDNRDFVVEVNDAQGNVYDVIQGAALDVGDTIWSLTVPSDFAEVSVYGAAALDGLAFEIDRVAFPVPGGALESIFGENDLIDVDKYDGEHIDAVARVESAVGRVSFVVGNARDNCSGFRVGADLIQTSRHCIKDDEVCASATVLFGYKKNSFNATLRGQQVRCAEVVASTSQDEADTVLFRVEPVPLDDYAIVEFRDADPDADEPLFIVQHPGGGAKQVSATECTRMDDDETDGVVHAFGHTCDTKGGSSGSPVFSVDGLVVGQQRAGHGNPAITDKLNLATLGSLLNVLTNAAPLAQPAPATTPNSAPSTDNATPLPLPTAPPGTGVETGPSDPAAPPVAASGSGGDGTVSPDTGGQ